MHHPADKPHTTASPELVVLLGHPVGHSLSAGLHNHAFDDLGLPYRYEAWDVPPGDLPAAVLRLRTGGFRGANVTVPHKETVCSMLNELSDLARAVGSVNTIVCDASGDAVRLTGHNTDVAGCRIPLARRGLPAGTSLVLGAGGAARAAVRALLEIGADDVVLTARRPRQSERLAGAFEGEPVRTAPWADRDALATSARLVVNATPLGMWPHSDASPLTQATEFSAGQTVFDLVYRPAETKLLLAARSAGAETIGGIEMFVEQAAEAFRLWTGVDFPHDPDRGLLQAIESE